MPRAQALAATDDHLFPALRLSPIPGETGIENMLRQIAALTQSPVTPLLLPARPKKERQLPGKAPSSRPAARRSSRQAGSRWRWQWTDLARFGSSLAAASILACGTLYPSNGQLAQGWALPGLDKLAGPPAASAAALTGAPTVTQGSGSDSPAGVPQAAAIGAAPVTASAPAILPLRPAARSSSVAVVSIPPLPAAKPPMVASLPRPSSIPAPVESQPSGKPEKAPAAAAAQPVRPALVGEVDGASTALLLARGNTLLAAGDVVSARQFFSRAAESGAAGAAAAMAKTYDPLFLGQIGAVGVRPDAARAVEWYRLAAKSGDASASGRLERLANDIGAGSTTPRPPPPLR